MNNSLAIIIPAYKIKYFDAALSSIAAQTNKNFKVYVCDDGSKEDIKSVTDKYLNQLNIQYYRFEDNAGKKNLVKHWNRSVELADEEWIWLFSDDDIMSPGCVQGFFDALQATKGKHNVYRFNIEMINADGEIICIKEPHPEKESGYQFLQRRLLSKSLSAAVEYIFKKKAFEQNSGFVNFPLAFCSDDASWIAFAGDLDIFTIQSEKVYWRSSNTNISSARGLHRNKIDAMLGYCIWLKEKFKQLSPDEIENWLFDNFKYVYGRPGIFEKYQIARRLSVIFHKSRFMYYKKLLFGGIF
ncbi:MAG TPA: glycosyltransferase family A protein [Mucilaginibacter sp.]